MSLYKQFKTDESIERTGVLLEYGETDDGKPICIRIARAGGGNKAFERRMEAESKPYRRQLQNETIDSKQLMKILRKVYSETVVIGWENVRYESGPNAGKDIPFTPENCAQLFTDLPDLFTDIQEQSRRAALFRVQELEDDAKN
jgi:hypothetical protein